MYAMQLKKNGGYAYIVADVTDTLSSGVNCVGLKWMATIFTFPVDNTNIVGKWKVSGQCLTPWIHCTIQILQYSKDSSLQYTVKPVLRGHDLWEKEKVVF
jgi:hypothetical protein